MIIENVLLFLTYFAVPLTFFPFFPSAFETPKMIVLATLVVSMVVYHTVKFMIKKKAELHASAFDTPVYLLVVAYLVSIILVAPNKMEALVDGNRGALPVLLLALSFFLLPQNKKVVLYASVSALFVLFVSLILSYASLFKFLPATFAFMNNKAFTPLGNLIDLVFYAAFFLALSIDSIRTLHKELNFKERFVLQSTILFSVPVIILGVFTLIKYIQPTFLPYSYSWQVTVEGIKNIKTIIFGVGPANFSTLFTVSKPVDYNGLAALWNITMEYSHSALLQVFTETGMLGLIGLGLIFYHLFAAMKKAKALLAFAVLVVWFVLFPLSFNVFFVLFLALYLYRTTYKVRELDLKGADVVAYVLGGIVVALLGASGYFFFRYASSEYNLGMSFVRAQEDKAQLVYDLQRQASIDNPYSEKVRFSFSKTNLLIANNMSQKLKLSDTEKQTIATLVQQAISEAKTLVTLNNKKATYWANLGEVYRNVLLLAQGADAWAISSYQRSLALDPNNPNYYFNLGSIYYVLGNYDESIRFFEQAAALKPNIPNFMYNLSWALFQKKDYLKAVNSMEAAVKLVDSKTDDYKKAKKELEEFKAMLPKEEAKTTEKQLKPETLSVPAPAASVTPQIKLPKDNEPPTQ